MPNSIEPTGKLPGRRLLLGVVVAAAVWSGAGHAQPDAAQARQLIGELYSGLRAIMHMGSRVPFRQRFDQLAPVIDRVFDLEAILQTSVGLRWASLDETARRTLFTVFRDFTIASYTANFDSDDGEKFEVLQQSRSSGDDVIVESSLIPASGDPVRIDYVMHAGSSGPRVIDVLLNGSISRVAVQRSDFRALLASGSATPLIDSLRKKVAELSDGAMRP